ncbi:8093_t:CDS:2, partial [Racocetra fulgida]
EIQKEYLICPDKATNFNHKVLTNFFRNSKLLLEKIAAGQEKTRPATINQLIIKEKKELFSPQTQEKLWELIAKQDLILLKVETIDTVTFLAKKYQLDKQKICQKLFGEKKNIVVISEEQ